MVGLQVVDDEVVEGASGECGGHILEELLSHRSIGGVEQGGFLIEHHIAVVRYSAGDGVDILEECEAAVAGANINQVAADGLDIMHGGRYIHLYV